MPEKYALITGAGRGLGRAVAEELSEQGYFVFLVARTESELQETSQLIAGDSVVIVADITSLDDVRKLRTKIEGETNHLDLMVNCAGEALIRPLEETTDADWSRILNENLLGHMQTIRELLPLIKESPKASIINILSKVVLASYGPGITAYTAAKTGFLGFSRALAAELREDEIRVVTISPGPMDTPMRWAATPDYDPKLLIDPTNVARTVSWLAGLDKGVRVDGILIESMHYH